MWLSNLKLSFVKRLSQTTTRSRIALSGVHSQSVQDRPHLCRHSVFRSSPLLSVPQLSPSAAALLLRPAGAPSWLHEGKSGGSEETERRDGEWKNFSFCLKNFLVRPQCDHGKEVKKAGSVWSLIPLPSSCRLIPAGPRGRLASSSKPPSGRSSVSWKNLGIGQPPDIQVPEFL